MLLEPQILYVHEVKHLFSVCVYILANGIEHCGILTHERTWSDG